jgi:hypothetical protein
MRWIWVAAVALACAAAAGTILLARGGDEPGAVVPTKPLTVQASLDRDNVEFGDPVTVTVTVLLDRASFGSSSVQVQENLAPLTALGGTRVTKATRGRLRSVTYTTRASCLDQRCISTQGSKSVALRPAVVRVAGHGTSKALWPTLLVRPRVSRADVAQPHPPLRSDTSPPGVTYRAGPARLARVLEVAAAVLAAAAVLLAAWTAAALVRARRREAPLTGLARAVALARAAERRPTPDRRRALGLLARLLGARDPRLAEAADELAWSAPHPTRDALDALVTQVEREVNGA